MIEGQESKLGDEELTDENSSTEITAVWSDQLKEYFKIVTEDGKKCTRAMSALFAKEDDTHINTKHN